MLLKNGKEMNYHKKNVFTTLLGKKGVSHKEYDHIKTCLEYIKGMKHGRIP